MIQQAMTRRQRLGMSTLFICVRRQAGAVFHFGGVVDILPYMPFARMAILKETGVI
jgi:hypothetical protein